MKNPWKIHEKSIDSALHWFTHWFIDFWKFTHSFTHLLFQPFTYSLIHSFIHSFNHSFIFTIYSFIQSAIDLLIYSIVHSSMHSFIAFIDSFLPSFLHSFIHSCMHACKRALTNWCIQAFFHMICIHAFMRSFNDSLNHDSSTPFISWHFIGMSTAICFNLSLLAHVSNIPTGHWVPKTHCFLSWTAVPARPGTLWYTFCVPYSTYNSQHVGMGSVILLWQIGATL